MLDYRHHDGSNQLGDLNAGAPYSDYTGFTPVNSWNQVERHLPVAAAVPAAAAARRDELPEYEHDPEVLHPPVGQGDAVRADRPDQFGPPATDRSWLPAEAQAPVDLQVKMNDANKASASYWADGAGTERFSGGTSEVFTRFAGTDKFKTALLVAMPARSSTIEPGLVPSVETGFRFTSFTDAANQEACPAATAASTSKTATSTAARWATRSARPTGPTR